MAFCQQTPSSTQSDEARRTALVAALERAQNEVRAGRIYIDGLKEQVKSKQARIDALDARDVQREKVEASLQLEIKNLLAAIDSQKKEIKIKEDEIAYLKKELDSANKKLKASHTREKIFAAVAAALAGILILHR